LYLSNHWKQYILTSIFTFHHIFFL
jgi:hypothetical protein